MFSDTDAVLAAIRSLQGTLQVATALALSGRSIELTGLDAEAARVCAAAAVLPRAAAAPLRPALEALLRDLDRAAAALPAPEPPPSPAMA